MAKFNLVRFSNQCIVFLFNIYLLHFLMTVDQSNRMQEQRSLEAMIKANYLPGTVFIIAITNQESLLQTEVLLFTTISRMLNFTKHKETTQLLMPSWRKVWMFNRLFLYRILVRALPTTTLVSTIVQINLLARPGLHWLLSILHQEMIWIVASVTLVRNNNHSKKTHPKRETTTVWISSRWTLPHKLSWVDLTTR